MFSRENACFLAMAFKFMLHSLLTVEKLKVSMQYATKLIDSVLNNEFVNEQRRSLLESTRDDLKKQIQEYLRDRATLLEEAKKAIREVWDTSGIDKLKTPERSAVKTDPFEAAALPHPGGVETEGVKQEGFKREADDDENVADLGQIVGKKRKKE